MTRTEPVGSIELSRSRPSADSGGRRKQEQTAGPREGGTRLESSRLRKRLDRVATRPQLERTTVARSWTGLARDVGVGAASALVVALLVAYTFAGPSVELSASVGPAVPRPGTSAFVLGRVLEADGSGLEGARVEVRRAGRLAGQAVSDDAGAFGVELRGGCSAYAVTLWAEAQGSTVGTDLRRRLCPGDALPIDARILTHGHFLWVPGPR